MKFRYFALSFCVGLLIVSLAGCGMKVPSTAGSSATPSASSDIGSAAGVGGGQTLLGVADNVNAGSLALMLVQPFDASGKTTDSTAAASAAPGTSPAAASSAATYVGSGSNVYTLSGGTKMLNLNSSTAVILESKGYAVGSVNDIAKGDFLAVAMNGNTVLVIIDNGPANNPANQNAPVTGNSGGMETTAASPSPSAGASPSPAASPNTSSAAASGSKAYIVNADNLKARSGPGTTYDILGQLPMGMKLTGVVVDGGWLQFQYNGKTAYCMTSYLKPDTSAAAASSPAPAASSTPKPSASTSSGQTTYKVTTANLKVRSGAGTSYDVLGTLPLGEKIEGVVSNGWCKFTFKGQTGYCSAEYLTAAN